MYLSCGGSFSLLLRGGHKNFARPLSFSNRFSVGLCLSCLPSNLNIPEWIYSVFNKYKIYVRN